MKIKWTPTLLVVACVAVFGVWYASPYLALYQMREAARIGDAEGFNAHVDYPKLRENLKLQLNTRLFGANDEAASTDSDWKKMAGGLGKGLGSVMVSGAVEVLVRPPVVMRALREGQMAPRPNAPQSGSGSGSGSDNGDSKPQSPADEQRPGKKVEWSSDRQGFDTIVFQARRTERPDDHPVGLVLERRGFLSWQLTNIQLPLN